MDRVRSWWPSYTLARKLKALKADIKRWNELKFRDVGALCIEKAEDLRAMESLEDERGLGEDERERKRVIIRDLEVSILQE